MTTTTDTKNPYDALATQQATLPVDPLIKPATTPVITPDTKQEEVAIPVQNTVAHVPDGTNRFDTIIKVIVDIVARLSGQPSPTGKKLPTSWVSAENVHNQIEEWKKKVWDKLTGGLQHIGDSMEKLAWTAVNSAWTVIEKARDTAQAKAQLVVDAAKTAWASAVTMAKDTASNAVNTVKDTANNVVDTTKNATNTTAPTDTVAPTTPVVETATETVQ